MLMNVVQNGKSFGCWYVGRCRLVSFFPLSYVYHQVGRTKAEKP